MSADGNAENQSAGAITAPPIGTKHGENSPDALKEIVKSALKEVSSSSRTKPEFDPVFRLFTVMYGTVVALTLKPFAEVIYKHPSSVTFCDVVLLGLLVVFFVVDWIWSAAYLLNYWLRSPKEHKLYVGFCKAKIWMRGILLVLHFGLICAFAVFANTAWLFTWNYSSQQIQIIPFEGRPVFWWLCSVLLAFCWDIVMYLGPVERHTSDRWDEFVKFAYMIAYGVTITALGWILFCEYVYFSGKPLSDIPHGTGTLTNAKHIVMFTLALQILVRIVTYFRLPRS